MGNETIRGPKAKRTENGEFDKRKNPFVGRTSKGSAPALADEQSLGLALDCVLACGCAVMLGHTRDGGALVLTILDGADRYRTYCADEVELSNAIAATFDMYKSD